MSMAMDRHAIGYRDVAEALREKIRVGAMPIGALLPTERELVESFRVSRTTVRRALAHLVTTGWAESIPNRGVSARVGRTSPRRQLIGFVDDAHIFEPHLFLSLNSRLQARGLVLTHVDSLRMGTEGALEFCADERFAAAVVWSKTINPNVSRIRRVQQAVPVIAVDHSLRGVETDVVGCDVFAGAKAAVLHLARLGRKRIAVAGMLDSLDTTQERFAGYLEGMFDAGLQPRPSDFLFTRTSGTIDSETERLESRLDSSDAPDAVLVLQDHVVVDVTTIASKLGKTIPRDLALVTMGSDEPFAALSHIGLTTAAFRWAQMADVLAERIFARIANPSTPVTRTLIPAELMVRGSCGAPYEWWTEQPPLPISSTLRPQAGTRGGASASLRSRTLEHTYRPQSGTSQPSFTNSTQR